MEELQGLVNVKEGWVGRSLAGRVVCLAHTSCFSLLGTLSWTGQAWLASTDKVAAKTEEPRIRAEHWLPRRPWRPYGSWKLTWTTEPEPVT